MKGSGTGIFFVLITSLALVGLYVTPKLTCAAEDRGFERAVSILLKRLRSESLRTLVKEKAKAFRKANATAAQRDALACFYDLRAREIFLALLASDENQGRGVVLEYYMDVFGPESVPQLYALASSKAAEPDGALELFSIELERDKLAKAVSRHVAKVLGVRPPEFPSTLLDPEGHAVTKKELRDWWLKVLKAAQTKNATDATIDRILHAIEEQEAK